MGLEEAEELVAASPVAVERVQGATHFAAFGASPELQRSASGQEAKDLCHVYLALNGRTLRISTPRGVCPLVTESGITEEARCRPQMGCYVLEGARRAETGLWTRKHLNLARP